MRLDAIAPGGPSADHDLPALIARLQQLAHSQPTAVLGVLDYWLGPHIEIDRLDLEA